MKFFLRYAGVCLAAVSAASVAGTAVAADRTIDGSGNNPMNWGAAETQLLRLSGVDYPDGSGTTMLSDRANPRAVSNEIFAQSFSIPNARGMTNGVWQWGQFLDHDISLTTTTNSALNGFHMILSPGDPYGIEMIPFSRSDYDPLTGTAMNNPRQQINSITSFIDASNVYGSDQTRADALRVKESGQLKASLKMSANNLLPLSTDDADLGALFMDDGGLGASPLFVAGDIRANEQTGLIGMHTLFAREHNRLVGELAGNNPTWDDQMLYQAARKIVGAEVQAITYNEFLPALLGPYAPQAADYSYSSAVNPSIATEFSTGLYRLGHSMLNSNLQLAGDGGQTMGSVSLRDAFFNPELIQDDPHVVEQVLMGLAMTQSEEIDAKLVDDVRNFLFAPDGEVGIDLASLNMQRGRDHGIPDYNTVRTAYKNVVTSDPNDFLPAITSFAEMTGDPNVLDPIDQTLQLFYGSVDNIDLWVGALVEEHVADTSVGPLILSGIVDQFTRLRDGDSFFYAGDGDLQALEIAAVMDLDTLTFMDIMTWNTGLEGMPESFFMGVPVPEPASLALLSLGLAAVLASARRPRCRVA